jgi:hypothetical protein
MTKMTQFATFHTSDITKCLNLRHPVYGVHSHCKKIAYYLANTVLNGNGTVPGTILIFTRKLHV